MPENEVNSEIATPEPDLALQDSGSVGTALAVIDHRPEEAALGPLPDATPEGSQADSLEQQDEADIELDTTNSLPASPIERDMQVLFQIIAICLLFHDQEETAYARYSVRVDGRLVQRVAAVRSRAFRGWLKFEFFRLKGRPALSQALQNVLDTIEAQAIYEGPEHPVYLRVAEHNGKHYVDLGDKYWRVVEIDAKGCRILDQSPVMFRRTKAMQALPVPDLQGTVDELRRFINVSDQEWPLILAWLVQALRPRGPYPVLVVHGEHGSSKSTACRFLRALVDPNAAPLRADYRSPRDLMISAHNGHVVALDNLSSIPIWLSDALCRLATGGGFSTRKLFGDDDETIFHALRPILLNGIEGPATREDLLDRALLVNLPRISQAQRVPEERLNAEFEAARPRILGALLTATSVALRNYKEVQLPNLPRMADFAIWATAAESALGLQPGEFMAAYAANRKAGNESAIEASPLGPTFVEWMAAQRSWAGTATALLARLEYELPDNTRCPKGWPADPRSLSGQLRRLAPHLREVGIAVDFCRSGKERVIRLNLETSASVMITTAGSSDAASEPVTQPSGPSDADPDTCVTEFPLDFEPEFMSDAGDAEFDELVDDSLTPVATTPK